MSRISALDGLRGVAIALVLLWHSVFAAYTPSLLLQRLLLVGKLSWSGVDLFFVLSGFLIGGILVDARESPRYFRTFYLRRVFRILPLSLGLACLYFLTAFFLPRLNEWLGYTETAIPAWTFFVFLQNFWMASLGDFAAGPLGVTWSLAVEEQFYLIAPWIVRKLSTRHLVFVLSAAIIAAPCPRALLLYELPHGAFADYVLMPCRADALSFGILCAILWRTPQAWSWLARHSSYLLAAWMLLVVPLAWLSLRNSDFESPEMVTAGYTLLAAFYACSLLAALLQKPLAWERLLNVRPLRKLGQLAFCVYLIHFPLLRLGKKYVTLLLSHLSIEHHAGGLSLVFGNLTGLVATIAIAQLSWKYFEEPLLRMGHRYRY
jgi:peptidoglycan/LPS O-acetylase OafA/YrhL